MVRNVLVVVSIDSICISAVGVISETIRKVTMARSMKNVKTAQVITLTATHRAITLFDPVAKKSIGQVMHVHISKYYSKIPSPPWIKFLIIFLMIVMEWLMQLNVAVVQLYVAVAGRKRT